MIVMMIYTVKAALGKHDLNVVIISEKLIMKAQG